MAYDPKNNGKHPNSRKNLIPRELTYKDDYPERLIEFFDRPLFMEINGKQLPSPLPTVEGFCREVKVARSTFFHWCGEHPEFKKSYEVAKTYQHDQLVTLTLLGFYKEGFARFLAANLTDLKTEQQLLQDKPQDKKKTIELSYNVEQVEHKE